MNENRTGLWIAFMVAAVLAVVFFVLWYMRGGDIDALARNLRTEQSLRSSETVQRDDDIAGLRRDLDAAGRDAQEAARRLADERARADRAEQEVERQTRSIAGGDRTAEELRERAEQAEAAAGAQVRSLTEELAEVKAALAGAISENNRLVAEGGFSRERISDLTAAEQAARKEIASLRAALDASIAELGRLAAGESTAREAAAAERDAREEAQKLATAAQAEIDRLTAAGKQARAEADAAEAGKDGTSALAARLRDAERQLSELRAGDGREREDAGAAASSGEEYEAAIARYQSELEAIRSAAAKHKADVEAGRAALARTKGELEKAVTAIAGQKADLEAGQEALAKIRGELKNAVDAASRQKTELNAGRAALAETRDALDKAMAEAAKQKDVISGLQGKNAEQKRDMANLREAFGSERPARTVGRVVDAMDNNKTVVISLGARQRIRPGMKFDVYRPAGDGNRYIGAIQVVRTESDTSVAVASFRSEGVMVCPVTGFAVLEPGALYSPFARGKNGAPVRLREAGSLNIPIEAPGAGDLLANPFYDPDKPLVFALADMDASDNSRKTVEMLGGIPKKWNTREKVDYAVVRNRDDFTPDEWENVPAVVTVDHICRYYEPVPSVGEPAPPPCPDPGCLPMRQ